MNRFDQDALFDRLAQRGRLDLALIADLATAVARFHREADPRRDHGGTAGMRWVVDGNAAGFSEFGASLFEPALARRVISETGAALERSASLLEIRRTTGLVRHCHGDLHLRNIVLLEGGPTIFDGVEFNDEIACIDVLYDLAFLLMDLWRRRMPAHANAAWNRYLAEAADLAGIALMPLFLSCRAAIRAKTNATALRVQTDPARAGELENAAREYLAMAERLLQPPPPCLVAIGGLSGSGKSTAAQGIAPFLGGVPGALVLRSDEVRKQIHGVSPHTRLGADAYTTEVSNRVYKTLADRAAVTLRGGFSAIVDATFLGAADRLAIESLAHRAAVPFAGLWLEAPEQALLRRLQQRGPDVSDADPTVLRMQTAQEIGAISWHRLDSSASIEDVRNRALSLLRGHVNDAEPAAKPS
jgi:predicted kinase